MELVDVSCVVCVLIFKDTIYLSIAHVNVPVCYPYNSVICCYSSHISDVYMSVMFSEPAQGITLRTLCMKVSHILNIRCCPKKCYSPIQMGADCLKCYLGDIYHSRVPFIIV